MSSLGNDEDLKILNIVSVVFAAAAVLLTIGKRVVSPGPARYKHLVSHGTHASRCCFPKLFVWGSDSKYHFTYP
jgi:hypothetical protein